MGDLEFGKKIRQKGRGAGGRGGVDPLRNKGGRNER